jgi:hypothetical protein
MAVAARSFNRLPVSSSLTHHVTHAAPQAQYAGLSPLPTKRQGSGGLLAAGSGAAGGCSSRSNRGPFLGTAVLKFHEMPSSGSGALASQVGDTGRPWPG